MLAADNPPNITIKAILNHQKDHLIKRQTVAITTDDAIMYLDGEFLTIISTQGDFYHCRSVGSLAIVILVKGQVSRNSRSRPFLGMKASDLELESRIFESLFQRRLRKAP